MLTVDNEQKFLAKIWFYWMLQIESLYLN